MPKPDLTKILLKNPLDIFTTIHDLFVIICGESPALCAIHPITNGHVAENLGERESFWSKHFGGYDGSLRIDSYLHVESFITIVRTVIGFGGRVRVRYCNIRCQDTSIRVEVVSRAIIPIYKLDLRINPLYRAPEMPLNLIEFMFTDLRYRRCLHYKCRTDNNMQVYYHCRPLCLKRRHSNIWVGEYTKNVIRQILIIFNLCFSIVFDTSRLFKIFLLVWRIFESIAPRLLIIFVLLIFFSINLSYNVLLF